MHGLIPVSVWRRSDGPKGQDSIAQGLPWVYLGLARKTCLALKKGLEGRECCTVAIGSQSLLYLRPLQGLQPGEPGVFLERTFMCLVRADSPGGLT
jgi:hypothetical protein